jgi:hypothetical protein
MCRDSVPVAGLIIEQTRALGTVASHSQISMVALHRTKDSTHGIHI